jgi:hypothetical protein
MSEFATKIQQTYHNISFYTYNIKYTEDEVHGIASEVSLPT